MKEPWMRKNRILAGILATGHNGEHHTEFQGTFKNLKIIFCGWPKIKKPLRGPIAKGLRLRAVYLLVGVVETAVATGFMAFLPFL
jgi:hypothetical protein